MSKTDPDQQAVYYSEEVAFANTLFAEPLHTEDLMTLADRLEQSEWWKRCRLPELIIEPTTAKDISSCATYDGVIRIAPTQINAWTLAHEAAHIAQFAMYVDYLNPDLEGHGREFRACYLAIAEILLGQDAAYELRLNFERRFTRTYDTICTVPKVDPDADSDGIYPRWAIEQSYIELVQLRRRMDLPRGYDRINGAIAL